MDTFKESVNKQVMELNKLNNELETTLKSYRTIRNKVKRHFKKHTNYEVEVEESVEEYSKTNKRLEDTVMFYEQVCEVLSHIKNKLKDKFLANEFKSVLYGQLRVKFHSLTYYLRVVVNHGYDVEKLIDVMIEVDNYYKLIMEKWEKCNK